VVVEVEVVLVDHKLEHLEVQVVEHLEVRALQELEVQEIHLRQIHLKVMMVVPQHILLLEEQVEVELVAQEQHNRLLLEVMRLEVLVHQIQSLDQM
tara:strand:+ start:324 stop:611 length:288 start_codon:yes stop_codon:yes gene_type:complete